MATISATRKGYTYHGTLRTAPLEEVAAVVRMRRRQTGGVMFARKLAGTGCRLPAKDSARTELWDVFSKFAWPEKLRILTLPGHRWIFERGLLRLRRGLKTRVFAFENDAAIFHTSVRHIPEAGDIRIHPSGAVETIRITYECADVFDAIPHAPELNAAWIDLTGFLSLNRMRILAQLWRDKISDCMAITALNARYDTETSRAIRDAGGVVQWMSKELDREPINQRFYADGVPMVQAVWMKAERQHKHCIRNTIIPVGQQY